MLVSILLLSIAAFDIRSHRIPNASLFFLALFSVIEKGLHINLGILVLTSCLVFLFTWASGCGYGDSKLALILLNFVIPSSHLSDYFLALLLTSTFLVALHLIHKGSLRGEIAFAPALCGAVLVLAPWSNF